MSRPTNTMGINFFQWLLKRRGDGTQTGMFADVILNVATEPIEVMGDGAGSYKTLRGFNQHCKTRAGAWFWLNRHHPKLLPAFNAAADEYSEIDPSWKKSQDDYKLENFFI